MRSCGAKTIPIECMWTRFDIAENDEMSACGRALSAVRPCYVAVFTKGSLTLPFSRVFICRGSAARWTGSLLHRSHLPKLHPIRGSVPEIVSLPTRLTPHRPSTTTARPPCVGSPFLNRHEAAHVFGDQTPVDVISGYARMLLLNEIQCVSFGRVHR